MVCRIKWKTNRRLLGRWGGYKWLANERTEAVRRWSTLKDVTFIFRVPRRTLAERRRRDARGDVGLRRPLGRTRAQTAVRVALVVSISSVLAVFSIPPQARVLPARVRGPRAYAPGWTCRTTWRLCPTFPFDYYFAWSVKTSGRYWG